MTRLLDLNVFPVMVAHYVNKFLTTYECYDIIIYPTHNSTSYTDYIIMRSRYVLNVGIVQIGIYIYIMYINYLPSALVHFW